MKERQMSWVIGSGGLGTLARTAVAAGIAGAAVMGATFPANATPAGAGLSGVPVPLRPGRSGMRHVRLASSALRWRRVRVARGRRGTGRQRGDRGIPAPAMVPNVDGTLSLPGTPVAI